MNPVQPADLVIGPWTVSRCAFNVRQVLEAMSTEEDRYQERELNINCSVPNKSRSEKELRIERRRFYAL